VCAEFWWGNLKEKDHVAGAGVDGRIILILISRKWDGTWNNLAQFGKGVGRRECGNEPSCTRKFRELLD
jgi:hypothetical protein